MEEYIAKYTASNIGKLFYQMNASPYPNPIEFIDPICAVIKLHLLSYKPTGTKLSIKNNKISIQESYALQGFQRWYNADNHEQLHQLKLPIFYFRGLVLGYIKTTHLDTKHDVLHLINDFAIQGLNRMIATYDHKAGSLVKNCLEDYVKTLSTLWSMDDYMGEMSNLNKPTIFAIYHEYTKIWNTHDFDILYDLFTTLQNEVDKGVQNKLADCVDCYVMAKDLKIDGIRPD